jgi:hypothetical protein
VEVVTDSVEVVTDSVEVVTDSVEVVRNLSKRNDLEAQGRLAQRAVWDF